MNSQRQQCWLMKSEPDVYGIDTLEREGRTGWDGIRNYQARNFMRDGMRVGDDVLFYHSNAKPPGVAGLARVSKLGLVDPSQFDSSSKYFDPKSNPEEPRWVMVEVEYVERFDQVLSLEWLKGQAVLGEMLVVQRGQRLSIQPVTRRHFNLVVKAGRRSSH